MLRSGNFLKERVAAVREMGATDEQLSQLLDALVLRPLNDLDPALTINFYSGNVTPREH